jgi:hypothetical protein
MHQFRVQDRCTGGTTYRVVTAGKELVMENRALTKTADEDRHALLSLDVPPGLRTVLLFHVNHRTRWSARQITFLRRAAILFKCSSDCGGIWLRGEFD